MYRPRLTRRKLLEVGLGATQLALLGSLASSSRPRSAWAEDGTPRPTKLLTLFFGGGWQPVEFFVPLSRDEIARYRPPFAGADDRFDPAFYDPDHVTNIDGTGDARDGEYAKIRIPILWDEASMRAGISNYRAPYTPFGWSWVSENLYQRANVVHGIDQGTASHLSGRISALCGAAGGTYRFPAIHSRVAAALFPTYGEMRPLPVVNITTAHAPALSALGLPSTVAPVDVGGLAHLEPTMSERLDMPWRGLRNRVERPQVAFDGSPADGAAQNEIEEYVRAETRRLAGANAATDAFYENLYDTYGQVSKRLALDLVSRIEATPGHDPTLASPFWSGDPRGYYSVGLKQSQGDIGSTWGPQFELALKLLNSDLVTAINVSVPMSQEGYWDTHGGGHDVQSVQMRAVLDVVGRLLNEMATIPLADGRTMLDDTLVVMLSDFARTWPKSGTCDHWPITSVVFAGANVKGNRMVGGYDFTGLSEGTHGPNGAGADLLDEDGNPMRRPLISADVAFTALHAFGIAGPDAFIGGGPGEIVGVLS